MIDLRWLSLGAAIFLVDGCTPPPAPIINVTVVIPPAPAPPPASVPAAKETWRDPPGDWPEWGWRVTANGATEGPPLEFIEQCYELAKTVQERPTSVGPAECHWVPIEASERDLSSRAL